MRGGVDEAACGARKESRRAEPAASGRKVARVAEGTPPARQGPPSRAMVPDGRGYSTNRTICNLE